jgi:hypothetical protein
MDQAQQAHGLNVEAVSRLATDDFAGAERLCRQAIRIAPTFGRAYINLAASLKEQGRIEEAREMLDAGMKLLPDNPAALLHGAAFELDLGAAAAAAARAQRALVLDESSPEARLFLANALLLDGRYREGWSAYESRKRYGPQAEVHRLAAKFLGTVPSWKGEPLAGRSLLVHSEQAIGEQVLFASCFGDVASSAARCVVTCDWRMQGLLDRSFPGIRFVTVRTLKHYSGIVREEGPFDFRCAMGDLPGLLGRDRHSIPGATAYLRPDPVKLAAWKERVEALGPGLKAGLSWCGGTKATGRGKRSLSPEQLRPLLAVGGVHWISLQYGECREDIAAMQAIPGVRIHHWQEAVDDIEEQAALCYALDHRISVCTSLVHLAGAMDLPICVLSPPATMWPYGMGDRMPWYPSARIYRQRRYRDWTEPVARAAADLVEAVRRPNPAGR